MCLVNRHRKVETNLELLSLKLERKHLIILLKSIQIAMKFVQHPHLILESSRSNRRCGHAYLLAMGPTKTPTPDV
jgi:hypothetical protein